MELKKCGRCAEKKELTDFHNSSKSKDGKQGYCKICIRASKRISTSPLSKKISLNIEEDKYKGLKLMCRTCNEMRPSFRFKYLEESYSVRRCGYCRSSHFKIPRISIDGVIQVDWGLINRREKHYIDYDNSVVNQENYYKVESFLKLVKSKRLKSDDRIMLDVNEIMLMIHLYLLTCELSVKENDHHSDLIMMYEDLLNFYKNFEKKYEIKSV